MILYYSFQNKLALQHPLKVTCNVVVIINSWIFNIFDVFQSFALILTDGQSVASLDSGSPFKESPFAISINFEEVLLVALM